MAITAVRKVRSVEVSDLHTGDRMTRREFHRAYEQTPKNFKAELIGGIVYVASPLGMEHGSDQPSLNLVVTAYAFQTQGVEIYDNTTILLGEDSEPQPDISLLISSEYGGRSSSTKIGKSHYIKGPPEWLGEIAHSSRAIDLHLKKLEYQRHEVLEYVVMSLKERRLRWFDLPADRESQPDTDGVYRMHAFPGLWIHGAALFAKDYQRLMKTLEAGLATPEHAAFVEKLADQHGRKKKSHPRK